tara:strand:+ start:167 stop:1390 length:1224 start_codon:yes stop_codon:yes gene_type:complete
MEEQENRIEEIVEETTQDTNNQQDPGDEHVEKPDYSKFNSADDDSVIKVDLNKPPNLEQNETKEDNVNTEGDTGVVENAPPAQEQEEVQPQTETQAPPQVEEITAEEQAQVQETTQAVEQAVAQSQQTGEPLPENVQKLLDFMNDTGGTIEDYTKLNKDYSKFNPVELVREYYMQTKPHLTHEEVAFLMTDQFGYDTENDEDMDIKRKQLAMKEQVAQARRYLEGQKSKYYRDLKAGVKLTPDQQKAINFYNSYTKETAQALKQDEALVNSYNQQTSNLFNDQFKGFEYKIGDKRFRYNVNNANDVRNANDQVNDYIERFIDPNTGNFTNVQEFHKQLYTAMNADAIANHFYEQGRADAMKNSIAKSKNIDMNPRQQHGEVKTDGLKFRVLGDDVASFKIKNNKFKQ